MDCRGVILSENRHARARSDSLFCTPPPEDDAANLLLAVGLPQVWPESDDGVTNGPVETDHSDSASQWTISSRKLDKATCSYTEPERSRQLTTTGLQHLPRPTSGGVRPPTAHYRRLSAMALSGDSLTALRRTSSASAATAGLHQTAKFLTPSCPSLTPPLPTNSSSAPENRASDTSLTRASAVRLIDYSSSEEEAETHKRRAPIGPRAKTRAKRDTKKYKSAEFVESESGGSDADTSDHSQHPRKDLPQTLKQTKPSKAVATLTAPAKMRMNDLSWGASSSSRKRPLPPTSDAAAAKRSKQGPFVVESGSEDDSLSDDYDSYNFDKHIAATPERPAESIVAEDRPRPYLEQEVKALATTPKTSTVRHNAAREASAANTLATQAGKLNKNRLLTMMAKKHGGPQNAARARSVSQDMSKSLPARGISTNLQTSSARRKVQATPTGPSAKLVHEQRRLAQDPISSNRNGTQTRTQQIPSPLSASTITRKTDAAQTQNAANSSSLRDLLDTQKTAHRKAAQEPDNIGSEWRRAQVGRAPSVSLAKDTHRPGVGARYGHTLGARKGNSQDKDSKSPKGAPATTGGNTSERTGSETHATSSTATQFPVTACGPGGIQGRVQQQRQQQTRTSISNDPLASGAAPTVERTSREDLRRPDLNAGLPSRSVHRIPPRLTLNKKAESVQGATAQRRNEDPRNNVTDGSRQRSIDSSPTGPHPSRANDRVATQNIVSTALENSASEVKTTSSSSKAPSKHNTSPTTTKYADRSRHAPDGAPNPVSSEVYPSQQVLVESSPISVPSRLGSDTRGGYDLNTQTSLMTAPAASSAQPESLVVEDVDKEIPEAVETINSPTTDHVVRVPDLYASSDSPTRPRMPVAVMVRPASPSDQSLRAQGAGGASSSPDFVVGTETGQTADVSGSSEYQRLSPDKGTIDTDTEQTINASLTRNRSKALAIPEAPESIDVSPDGQTTVTQDQSAAARVELTVDKAISKHSSERSLDIVEPAESVDNAHNKLAPNSPSTPETLPPASNTTSGPGSPLLGTNPGLVLPEARTTPIPSSTLMSQPAPALSKANDGEKSTIEHPRTAITVESPTSSSTAEIALPSPTLSPIAEPYFEYTIHQSITSSSSSMTKTELSVQPFTALDSANVQTDKLFQKAKQQYELLGMRCTSTTSRVLDNGLSVHEALFISIDDPSRSLTLKLWIERAEVSVYANHMPSLAPTAPLISKTLYALRLWRLAEQADSNSDPGAEDDDDDGEQGEHEEKDKEQFRIYHPLPHICTELHTSLESANRAAKRVQIELSHEKAPKSMQAQWQLSNLRELNEKLEDLRQETEDGDNEGGRPSRFEYEEGRRRGCWRSKFKGVGHNGYDFELLVTSVGVSGPRNV